MNYAVMVKIRADILFKSFAKDWENYRANKLY